MGTTVAWFKSCSLNVLLTILCSIPIISNQDVISTPCLNLFSFKFSALPLRLTLIFEITRNAVFSNNVYRPQKIYFTVRHPYPSVKNVSIRSFSGPYFLAFGLNTEGQGAFLRIQSDCGKYGPEKFRIWKLFKQFILRDFESKSPLPTQ